MNQNHEKNNYESILSSFRKKKILVLGDLMLDHYIFGEVNRISPEAPIPILKKTEEEFTPGGAANVANNLVALGAKVTIVGVIGDDFAGEKLLSLLKKKGIRTGFIYVDKKRPTTLKQRLVSKNSQIVRLDEEVNSFLDQSTQRVILARIKKLIPENDALILVDYAKGFFSENFSQEVIKIAKKNKKIILADTKPSNKAFFKGVDVVKPNFKESKEMSNLFKIEEIGPSLVKYFKSDVVITRGENGISIFTQNGKSRNIPTKKINVVNIVGAGDTAGAVLTLSLSSGASLEEAAVIANSAGTVVVQKPGTATLNVEELSSALYDHSHFEDVSIVPKLWGYEKWLENNDKYCCKILSLNKDYQCSLHYHRNKDEMFVVTSGHVRLELGDKIIHMREGNFTRIPPGTKHRFTGMLDSLIMEVSTHHEEEDTVRIEESRKVE